MGGFRTIDLSDDVVKSRKIGAQEVKAGTFAHYTKLTDIDAAFVVATVPSGGVVVEHPLGKVPAGVIVISKSLASNVYTFRDEWTAAHFCLHASVHDVVVHAIVL